MSLTSMIEDTTTRPVFLACAPNRLEFLQPYGPRAGISPHPRVSAASLDRDTRRHIGRAFDYLARAIVARAVGDSPDLCQPKCAELGLMATNAHFELDTHCIETGNLSRIAVVESDPTFLSAEEHGALVDAHKDALSVWNGFIARERNDRDALINAVDLFAGLEKVFRMRTSTQELPHSLLLPASDHIKKQLQDLWDVFAEHNSMFLSSTRRIYNPSFGSPSSWVGGADGDLIIDDMLIDFKVTQSPRIWEGHSAQLVSYKLLDDRSEVPHGVKRVAIYFARFGCWRVCDVSRWQPSEELSQLIDKRRRDHLGLKRPSVAARVLGIAAKGTLKILRSSDSPAEAACLSSASSPTYQDLWQAGPVTPIGLTGLQGIGPTKAAKLVAAGFKTIDEVADAAVDDLQRIVGKNLGPKLKSSAVAVLLGRPQRRKPPGRFPQRYIVLDLETSLSSRAPFLLAVLPSWEKKASQFLELDVIDHHKLLDELEELANQHRTARFVSWSSFDRAVLVKLAKEHRLEVPWWLEAQRWIDACAWTDKAFAFPSGDKKLKSLARGLGFTWHGGDLDGQEVGGRYETYLRTGEFEGLEEVVRYCLDDVYAVQHVIECVRAYAAGGDVPHWAA